MENEDVELSIGKTVYMPAEDSFLLAKYAGMARGRILDMGSGCGICAIAAASADKRNRVLAVDINPGAVKCAKENAAKAKLTNIAFLVSDLFGKIPKSKKFDFIIFNPPYLPTSPNERLKGKRENAAYDGGRSGRKVLDRFLKQFEKHLAQAGSLLLLDSSLDGTGKTIKILESKGFSVEILEQESFFFEELSVLLAQRKGKGKGVAHG